MSNTPTPKTDAMASMLRTRKEWQSHGEGLERELAEVTHQMEKYATEARSAISAHELVYRELAEASEQRDRLAEALRPFIDGWSHKSCDSIVTEQQFRDAKQALAAVKGGEP
jgi:exonuclease VII large subunit